MDELIQALNYIDVASLNYQEWTMVGMAIKSAGYPCSVWDEWSRNDPRYHPSECQRKWETFQGEGYTKNTIFQMAYSHGFAGNAHFLEWDDAIEYDGEEIPVLTQRTPVEDLKRYIELLFEPDDLVNIVTSSFQDADGRYKPVGKGVSLRAADIIRDCERYTEFGEVIADYDPAAGAWIRFNPVDGEGVGNNNITAYRYALVESDSMSIDDQKQMFVALGLPIKVMVNSGSKSIHAIVNIGAKDKDEYRAKVKFLYEFLKDNDVEVDTQNSNPSRLSRCPGVTRGDTMQYIIAENIGPASFEEWQNKMKHKTSSIFIETFGHYNHKLPELTEELIFGVLRMGHKMILSGASKTGKSFCAIELAVALTSGKKWLSFDCRQCDVLYFNFEIQAASFLHRVDEVRKAMGVEDQESADRFHIANMRSKAAPLNELVDAIVEAAQDTTYGAIILDPLYKIGIGDENSASDTARFCAALDEIAERTGASVIFVHHFAKGQAGQKSTIDRASGSGALARDPDAIVTITELQTTEDYDLNVKEYGETPMRFDFVLREFASPQPVDTLWKYPIHRIDESGQLAKFYPVGDKNNNLALSGKRTSEDERLEKLDAAFEKATWGESNWVKRADLEKAFDGGRMTLDRYLKEFTDYYRNEKGIIYKVE